MSENLVTVITFVYPHELGVPRSLLESEEIECFVPDELTTSVQPFYSMAIGGVRLQVRESDAQRATEILINGGFINRENNEVEKSTEIKQTDGTTCPYCGSAEIVKSNKFTAKSSFFVLSFVSLLTFCGCPVPFFFRRHYHCMDCGKDFKKRR